MIMRTSPRYFTQPNPLEARLSASKIFRKTRDFSRFGANGALAAPAKDLPHPSP
jgi:hypothetical protein